MNEMKHQSGGCCAETHDHDGPREHRSDDHGSCACGSGTGRFDRTIIFRIAAAAVLLAAGYLLPFGGLPQVAVYIIALVVVGHDVVINAFRNLLRGFSLDENLLMTLACIGAFGIGDYAEGILVMTLYQVGELFQGYAVSRSRKSIKSLVDLRPETVNIVRAGEIIAVPAGEAAPGDILLVKPGERIALDGTVLEGSASLDTSALTGESLPRAVWPGSEVLSGSVNQDGLLKIEVTKVLSKSAVSRILDMVEEAAEKKSKPEKFITKFAAVYTPIVLIAAILVAVIPVLFFGQPAYEWIRRALTFLVISCPCALVISVPLTYFAGIGGASRRGVLFKGSSAMYALSRVGTVVFDKTGTLTTGEFRISRVEPVGMDADSLLKYAAHAEMFSDHPLARSIVEAYGGRSAEDVVSEYVEVRGRGVSAIFEGKRILAGNLVFLRENGVDTAAAKGSETTVFVAVAGEYAGCIVLSDMLKPDAKSAVTGLKALGIGRTVMLTGDNEAAAESVSAELGIGQYRAECLPEDKSRELEALLKDKPQGESLAYIGDGINDAPVLVLADVGVAMGALGSDAAIEASDVVIVDDTPSKIVTAVKSAKKTHVILVENIAFALSVKLVVMALGILGIAPMSLAIFADVGVSLLAILNAGRAFGR